MDYERYPPIIFADDFDQRSNIAWRVEPAKDRQVLLEPRYPWDSASTCTGHGTVLRDPIDGRWKGWFVAVQENLNHARGKHDFRLVHVVSEDGRQWTRPELDLCPFEGYPRTNILFDYESGGRTTYASVFRRSGGASRGTLRDVLSPRRALEMSLGEGGGVRRRGRLRPVPLPFPRRHPLAS